MADSKSLDRILRMSKALGDETRLAVYRFLTTRSHPVPVTEVAAEFSLHPNAARAHLSRLDEAGLAVSFSRRANTPGRPRRLYEAAPGGLAPIFEPAAFRALAGLLLELLSELPGVDGDTVRAFGVRWGSAYAGRFGTDGSVERLDEAFVLEGLVRTLATWGFTAARLVDSEGAVVVQRCAFGDLAERHRGLVCPLVSGVLNGMMAAVRPDLSLTHERNGGRGGEGRCVLRLVATSSSSSQ